MSKWKLYNPEGMQDILVDRCYIKRNMEKDIRDIFRSKGYMEIETPTVEFYDVFSNDTQLISQENMFKFVDEKGRILVLRPDITIPIARVAGTKLSKSELPLKVSYIGKCYRYNNSGGGKQREFTEAGIEIMGSDDSFYDAQVIVTAIETMLSTGISEFTIELGQVEFFKGLMEEAQFDEALIETIRKMIEAKDYFGIEELLKDKSIDMQLKNSILSLSSYFGDRQMLDKLKMQKLNKRSKKAIENLLEILDIIEEFGLLKYISIDLAMVKKIEYYTGMIFRGLTYGIGFPIISGGRYNSLCEIYGRKLSATGFSIGIDVALTVLQRNNVDLEINNYDTLVSFKKEGRKTAIEITKQLTKQGLKVDLISGDYNKKYATQKNIPGIINVLDEENIEVINILDKTLIKTTISQLLGGND